MSTKKIKQVLKKKGIPYESLEVERATYASETVWVIMFSAETKDKIIQLSNGDITEDDFWCGFGGNAEDIRELLDMLPDMSQLEV